MRHVTLCDGPVTVEIEATNVGAILTIRNDEEVSFTLAKSNLVAVLEGETIQVSHRGVFCKLRRDMDNVLVTFAWKTRHEQVKCPASKLRDVLDCIGADCK